LVVARRRRGGTVTAEDVLAVDATFAPPGIEDPVPEAQRLAIVDVEMGVVIVVKPGRRLPGKPRPEVDAGVIEEADHVVIEQRENDAPGGNRKEKERKGGDRLVAEKFEGMHGRRGEGR